jgi:hypothetical protein
MASRWRASSRFGSRAELFTSDRDDGVDRVSHRHHGGKRNDQYDDHDHDFHVPNYGEGV